jgi:hypothetical protein
LNPPWLPWSLWITAPPAGLRLLIAIESAFVTSDEAWWLSIDQPTTFLE